MRPSTRTVSWLVTLVCLAVTAQLGACTSVKKVTVDGRVMTESEAEAEALRDLERLRRETRIDRPAAGAERFDAFAARYREVQVAAEALYEAGSRWRAAKRPERAQASLSRLLMLYPMSRHAVVAKHELARSELDAGRPREALATLSSLYDKLPPSEQPAAAQDMARAAEAIQNWPEAIRWRAEAARLATGENRAREVQKAVEHIDARLPPADLARLRETLPPDSPLLPAVMVRVARAQVVSDEGAARRTAEEVVSRWPDSPYAPEARAILDRIARRVQVNPRVIGVVVPVSGKLKPWGEAIMKGVSLALEGSPFRAVVKDSRGEPEGAKAALEELAVTGGAIAALGGVVNAEALRAAGTAQEQGLPFVSLARLEGVTQAGPFVFRNMLTAEAQAKALADLAMGMRGMRRFAMMWPQIPYGQELARSFWTEVEARGGEVRGAEPYEADRTTFSKLVKEMVGKLSLDERRDYLTEVREVTKTEKNPYRRRKALEKVREQLAPVIDFDAIFIPDFAKNVALIAPALAVEDVVTQTCDPKEVDRIRRTTGREDLKVVQLLGANGWDDPLLVERAGKYVECALFVDGFFPGSERPETKAFVAAFQQKYGHLPSILEASAYDTARVLRRALEGGTTNRDMLREQLTKLKGFPGATGVLSFDQRREISKQLFYLTVVQGVLREAMPNELARPTVGG